MSKRKELDPHLGSEFSRQDALARGTTRDRLSASDLSVPFRGARSRRVPLASVDDPFEAAHLALIRRCQQYIPIAPRAWAFSHVTAARLYRMPLPLSLQRRSELDVAVPRESQPPRRAGVTGHRLGDFAHRAVEALPVVHPEVAWRQIAPLLSLDELVIAGDHLVRRKRPASTLDKLARELCNARGSRGVRVAEAALLDVRVGTDSPRESVTRLILVRAGLPEPLVRYTVIDDDGYFVGTPDLAYPVERIAIEYEGEGHRTDEQVYEDDIHRREMFRRAGWLVILVTARKLQRPNAVVSEVADALRERAVR